MMSFLGLNREEMTLNLIILENKIKEKETLNAGCQKESIHQQDPTPRSRVQSQDEAGAEGSLDNTLLQHFSELYIQYIKNLANF
mmetsp:Transcript_42724/g.41051  ORF Transcript_42724/g.41051 Transcript_42724/m.41051 type:complete len:84 (-) Transcript_42724:24-275(-)